MHRQPSRNPIPFGLSLTAGAGLTLMMVALGLGVVNPDAGSEGTVGFMFIVGVLLLVGGIAAWVAVVRPFEHFDDINQPRDSGHGHDHGGEHPAPEGELLLPDGSHSAGLSGEEPALPAPGQHAH